MNNNGQIDGPAAESREVIDRLMSKVRKGDDPDGCWIWTGWCDAGYGRLQVKGRRIGAHRLSYELFIGPIGPGMHCCHRCDVPTCVNPRHLFLGAAAANVADRHAKGRTAHGERHMSRTKPESVARGARHGSRTKPERVPRGEKNGSAKLTEADVVSIREQRAAGATTAQLGTRFGVSITEIACVASGKVWAHVGGPRVIPASNRKLTEADVLVIREQRAAGKTTVELGKRFGVNSSVISETARGIAWSHVGGPLVEAGANKTGKAPDRKGAARGARNGMRTHPHRVARGERNGQAKLSERDVRTILAARATGVTQREIAARYGVTGSLISAIEVGRAWKHVQQE